MKKYLMTLLVIGAIFGISAQAVEYQSPRTLALGGAGRGGPFLNDSIYLNPSFASFNQVYTLSYGYNWFEHGRNYNISIQDSRTELFQAGIGFTKREQNAALSIGASKMVVDRLGVGIGTKTLIDNIDNNMTTDFSISSSFLATHEFYSSIILDNLIQSSNAKARNLYRTLYLGMKYQPITEAELFFDPLYSPDYSAGKKFGWSLGVELTALSDFYVRFGRFQDGEVAYVNSRGTGFGLGIGYVGPKFHFDYAMNRVTSAHSGIGLTTSNSIEMTLFF